MCFKGGIISAEHAPTDRRMSEAMQNSDPWIPVVGDAELIGFEAGLKPGLSVFGYVAFVSTTGALAELFTRSMSALHSCSLL